MTPLALITLFSLTLGESSEFALRPFVEEYVQQWAREAGIESVAVEYRTVQLPAICNEDGVELRLVRELSLRKGKCALPIEVIKEGRTVTRFVLPILVRTYEHVYVAKQILRRGERFTPQVVEKVFLETTHLPVDVITEGSVLENCEAARIINEQSVLTKSRCKAVPVLNPQDVVTLRVTSGAVVLTTSAIAKESGVIGDVITVQSTTSRKQYKAKVLDARTVEIIAEMNVR